MHGLEETKGALEMVIRERADALFVSDCVSVPAVEFIELAAKEQASRDISKPSVRKERWSHVLRSRPK